MSLSHPHVVKVFALLKDPQYFGYAMELSHGGSLMHRLRSAQQLAISDIIRMLLDVCRGLSCLHDVGIVHRGLFASSVLFTADFVAQIADACLTGFHEKWKNWSCATAVPWIYTLPPEWITGGRGVKVEPTYDIHAIGVLAYRAITGRSPFTGKDVHSMVRAMLSQPIAPSTLRHDCPQRLDDIVLRAIQPDPNARYRDAGDLLGDLYKLSDSI